MLLMNVAKRQHAMLWVLITALAGCAGKAEKPADESASAQPPVAYAAPQGALKAGDTASTPGTMRYETIVERIKARGYAGDFSLLRTEYTKTALYQPFDQTERDQARAMFEALDANDLAQCVKRADAILARNFTSLAAHMGAAICHGRLEQSDLQQLHAEIYDGLINSIASTGNGSSPQTAFVVINTDEIYGFLQAQDLEVVTQALVQVSGKDYDLMTIRNPRTNQQYGVYFDISAEQAFFARKMGGSSRSRPVR